MDATKYPDDIRQLMSDLESGKISKVEMFNTLMKLTLNFMRTLYDDDDALSSIAADNIMRKLFKYMKSINIVGLGRTFEQWRDNVENELDL